MVLCYILLPLSGVTLYRYAIMWEAIDNEVSGS